MYQKECVWLIPNDDNRLEDGVGLRAEFLAWEGIHTTGEVREWFDQACSFLELMVALSRRLAFEEESRDSRDWFWEMASNLNLHQFNDYFYNEAQSYCISEVDEILTKVIWRRYTEDGAGGLFPLKHPSEDQTRVELWYQMNSYLLELG